MPRVQLTEGTADLDTGVFHGHDGRKKLTTKERDLLAYLVARPSDVVTREELLESVWGYHPGVRSRAVDKTLTRLRAKIGDDGRDPLHLHTVHGVGYRFEPLRTAPVQAVPPTLGPTDPPFLGRDAELARLTAALEGGARVVGIIGVAGVGKTRLLAEFLAAWTHPVVATASPRAILDVLCEHLALPVPAEARPDERLDQLGRALAARGAVLLALDGVEQALDELRPALPRLLELAPGLRIVATSRRALPVDHVRLELGSLSDADAMALFLARARARRADFAFADADQGAALVHRLDSLPLAIELAAARVGVLSAGQLLDRLQRRFEVLHEGLQGALDTSWDLLSDSERAALAQCAVFRGGFDLLAAEAVVRLPRGEVLDALEALRDHSLVQARAPADEPGGLRFTLYESVADHARPRLHDPDALRRHTAWCLEVGEAMAEGAEGPDAERSLRRLHQESENLQAVYARHVHDAPELAARAALALHALRTRRGPVEGQLALLDGVAGVEGDVGVRVGLATAALLTARGRWAEARGHLDRAAGLARGESRLLADVLAAEGAWHHRQAHFAEAEARFREALGHARADGDRRREARVLGSLGASLQLMGRVADAEDAYREALSLHRAAGNRHREATILSNLGVLRVAGGSQAETGRTQAEAWFLAALAWAEASGDVQLEGRVLGNLAALYLDWLRLDDAEPRARRALELARLLGLPRTEAAVLGTLARTAHIRGELDAAERHALAGLASARIAGSAHLEGLFLCGLAALGAARGEAEVAARHLIAARSPLESSRQDHLLTVWAITEGHLHLLRGERDAARALLEQPEAARRSAEVRGALTLLERALDGVPGTGP